MDDIPSDLAITEVELVDAHVQITFSDGFTDRFDGPWLLAEAALNEGLNAKVRIAGRLATYASTVRLPRSRRRLG